MNQLIKRNGIKFVKEWLPVLLWAIVIFLFSTEHFAAPQSSRILGPLLHWLFPDITAERVSSIQFVIRKFAHWFEYFVLAVLLYRALYAVAEPLYPVLARVAPRHVTTVENIGKAMIRVSLEGYPQRLLENPDINMLGSVN